MRSSRAKRITKSSSGTETLSNYYVFLGSSTGGSQNKNLEKLGRMKTKRYLMDLAIRKLLPSQVHLSGMKEAEVRLQQIEKEKRH